MSIALVVTAGFGNGTLTGSIADVVTRGYTIGEVVVAPILPADIKINVVAKKMATRSNAKKMTVTKWLGAASSFGVSASSVVWTVDDGTSVTISGTPTITTNISTGTIVAGANKTGCSLVKVKATMTDSQTITAFFKINVIDPSC
jgi:hypothetical protein